ncbi:hypothetical protein [Brevibacillus laterosporus]|uniref:hypothetical protein n=1 Tax=Brevibacillus laterosporus TaxID=1465 RepID=UPI002405EE1E|nr:hypothetical protein [Brevibacillus laterosporus]
MEKMTELEEQRNHLEFNIKELDLNNKKTVITEDILRQLFGMFKIYVTEKTFLKLRNSSVVMSKR